MLLAYFLTFYFLLQWFCGKKEKNYCYTWIYHALSMSQPWGGKMDKMRPWSTFPDLFLQVYEQNKMNSRCFPRKQQIKEPFIWILHRLNMNKMNPTSGPFFFFISLKNRYNNAIHTYKKNQKTKQRNKQNKKTSKEDQAKGTSGFTSCLFLEWQKIKPNKICMPCMP